MLISLQNSKPDIETACYDPPNEKSSVEGIRRPGVGVENLPRQTNMWLFTATQKGFNIFKNISHTAPMQHIVVGMIEIGVRYLMDSDGSVVMRLEARREIIIEHYGAAMQ